MRVRFYKKAYELVLHMGSFEVAVLAVRQNRNRVRCRARCLMQSAESWGYLPPTNYGEEKDP